MLTSCQDAAGWTGRPQGGLPTSERDIRDMMSFPPVGSRGVVGRSAASALQSIRLEKPTDPS